MLSTKSGALKGESVLVGNKLYTKTGAVIGNPQNLQKAYFLQKVIL